MAKYADLDCERQIFLLKNQYAVELLITVLADISNTSKEICLKRINQYCNEFIDNLSNKEIKVAILEVDKNIILKRSPEGRE